MYSIDCGNHIFEHAVSLVVYDITGEIINDLGMTINKNKIFFEKKRLIPGLYFYKIYDGEKEISKGKVIIQE